MAVAALAASMMATTVSAADWAQTGYADNDPTTVRIVSSDENGVTFTTTETSPDICKARITLDKVLKNPEDYSKIAKMEWKVTYKGITPEFVAEGGLAGGTWCSVTNSNEFNIKPEMDAEENYIWEETEYSITDSVTFEDGQAPEKDGELVFMDWSYANIGSQNVTVTISDLKIFDKDGNEIEQLGFGEYTAAPAEDTSATDTTETETTENTDATVTEENAKTGNEAPVIALAALAASAVVCAKKRK